jgi:putative oxidoreductase
MKNSQFNIGVLILRLSLGLLLLFHGYSKIIHGVEGLKGLMSDNNLPEFLAYGVYVGEVVAPLLMVIGYRTKIASLIISATMFVAIFTAHSEEIFSLNEHGGWAVELPALYFFGSLAIFFLGGGKIALSSSNKWD